MGFIEETFGKEEAKKFKEETRKVKKGIKAVVVGIFAIITIFNSFSIVSSGETGVRIRVGQVQEETLEAGLHLKIPYFESIKKVSNKQTDVTYDGKCWCESSEQVPVYYEAVALSYQIAPSASVWLYKNVNKNIINDGKSLIKENIVASALKNASVQLPTRDVTKRACIEPLATKELQASLDEKYGEGNVTVVKLSIGNADFEPAYNDVIAQRQSAQITYEKQQIENKTAIEKANADAEKLKIDAEAEAAKKKIDAEAEAEATKTKAEGEAEAIKAKADAQAEANEKLQKSLTSEIITNNYINKWDGELPKVQSGDGLILDASEFIKSGS